MGLGAAGVAEAGAAAGDAWAAGGLPTLSAAGLALAGAALPGLDAAAGALVESVMAATRGLLRRLPAGLTGHRGAICPACPQ